jgi:hypothetical protein
VRFVPKRKPRKRLAGGGKKGIGKIGREVDGITHRSLPARGRR